MVVLLLPVSGRAVLERPIEIEQVLHVRVGPPRWRGRPRALKAAPGAVALAEGVAACHQGNGLLVTKVHLCESLAYLLPCGGPCVHVDQVHRARGRIQEGEALAPVDGVHAAAAEGNLWATHGLNSSAARQDDQVTPAQRRAVLVLDRTEEVQHLVQSGVVPPAVLRIEADARAVAAATPVRSAVRARTVPSQPDHEATVVPKIC
mmetsp:Transcript_43707/g.130553  ORF Transcript_43707/g.130553 Transcript_43707/m.130553 type:complete len:205 (-) Transcript_43707:258-872(-)